MNLKPKSKEEILKHYRQLDEGTKVMTFFNYMTNFLKMDYVDGVKMLIEGTDLNLADLMVRASQLGALNVVKYLHEIGVDPDNTYNAKMTFIDKDGHFITNKLTNGPICVAAKNGHFNLVKYLISIGYNIHDHREYALRHAVEGGYYDIVKLLLENGADPTVRDFSASRIALKKGYKNIFKLIDDYILEDKRKKYDLKR